MTRERRGASSHAPVDWTLLTLLGGRAVAGSLTGPRLSWHARPESLRRALVLLVFAMAVLFLSNQVRSLLMSTLKLLMA